MARLCGLLLVGCTVSTLAQAQVTARDTTAATPDTSHRRGPFMLELSAGRTKLVGVTSGGGPGTAAIGIGSGYWFTDRVMLGLEGRAHGTIDIEPSVPSVRFVSGVVALRRVPGEPVVRLGLGPAWVTSPQRSAVRTTGYSASLEIPFEPDLRQPSLVVFLRYSGTSRVSTPPTRPDVFRTSQLALGLRLEL